MSDKITHISQLNYDKRNPRKHNPRNIGVVVDSLQKVGFARSIVIDEDNNILAGNGVTEAATLAGIEKVVEVEADGETIIAVRRRGLSDEDKTYLKYADNRSSELAAWSPDVILADFEAGAVDFSQLWNEAEWSELLESFGSELLGGNGSEGEPPAPQIDRAAELQAVWGTEVGQVWQLGDHRLAIGDCTDKATVEAVMRGELADSVFTSPPYAVGVDYDSYDDTIENLRTLLPKCSGLWFDSVVEGGYAVINFGDIASGRNIAKVDEPCEYPMALEYWPIFRNDGWLLWSRRIWCKPNPRVHSPWCIQSNRAATDWEHLWTWKKPGKAIVQRVDGELRSPLGWIDTSLMTGVEVGKETHGAGMALGIACWMVNVHSRPGKVVIEPFCGTGTTLIACQNLNRRCRAIEIDRGYAAVSLQRWADLTKQQPQRVSG